MGDITVKNMQLLTSLLVIASLYAPMQTRDTIVVDNRTYIGEVPAGRGTLYHKEKGLFIGAFNKTVPSGRGIHIKADGSMYSGNFVNGVYQGYGRLFMATGAVICGEFRSGYANGRDTLYYPDGKVFIGIVMNNGATEQGKTYKGEKAAKVEKPARPDVQLSDEDIAFLESIGYGNYDSPAIFGSGTSFFEAYIAPNFRYSESMEGKMATVYYEFVVGEDGKLRDIKILSSTDEAFSKELERVLKRCPRWTPAMKDGKPVPFLIRDQKVTFGGNN